MLAVEAVALVVGVENPSAACVPSRLARLDRGDLSRCAPGHRNLVEFRPPLVRVGGVAGQVVAGALEQHRATVGGKAGHHVVGLVVGQPPGRPARKVQDVNVERAVSVAAVGNTAAVRRPAGVRLHRLGVGQRDGHAAGHVHSVNVPRMRKGQDSAVGRQCRVAKPSVTVRLCVGRWRQNNKQGEKRGPFHYRFPEKRAVGPPWMSMAAQVTRFGRGRDRSGNAGPITPPRFVPR